MEPTGAKQFLISKVGIVLLLVFASLWRANR